MLRRFFLTMLLNIPFPQTKKKVTELDKLVFEYQQLFNSATFIGDQVLYDRDLWDNIRDAFTKIISACVEKKSFGRDAY